MGLLFKTRNIYPERSRRAKQLNPEQQIPTAKSPIFVETNSRFMQTYPVITAQAFEELNRFLEELTPVPSRIFILADEHTHRHCMAPLIRNVKALETAEILEIDAGEANKNVEIVYRLWEVLAENNVDRQALIVNLGGGLVSDLGGFLAAGYKRGIRFINVPTSLLAMIDAAVGGKTGVNLGNLKNQIGCFKNPEAVFVWPEFLETLPLDEMTSGYGELIKYALLDPGDLWPQLHERGFMDIRQLQAMISKALQIKLKVVEEDPYEKGLRKILNLGHTYGHAFESLAMEEGNPLSHGHAVALGLVCELWHSVQKKQFPQDLFQEISGFILNNFKPYPIAPDKSALFIDYMRKDKKNRDGQIAVVLLEGLGQTDYEASINEEEIARALDYYRNLSNDANK